MHARLPRYANVFFYADAGRLRAVIESSIEDSTSPKVSGSIYALVVPHGTHLEMGPIAGYAYKQLLTTTQTWDTVTLLAPQLRLPSSAGLLIDPCDGYGTPLGLVQKDQALLAQLRSAGVDIADAADDEPIVESHLPFLQTALGETTVLALRVSTEANLHSLSAYANALGLIVAAGNLPAGNEHAAADAIVRMDVAALTGKKQPREQTRLSSLFTRQNPIQPNNDLHTIALALQLAQARGATQVRQLFVAGQFGAFVAFG